MTYIPRSSSAIPDSVGSIPKAVRKKYTLRVFNIVTTMVFIAALLGAGGVYFLKSYAGTSLENAKEALSSASSPDDARLMESIGTFDRRLGTTEMLLDNHLAPSLILQKLEALTKETVQLTSFTYEYDPGFEAILSFTANTRQLTSVALQRLAFAADSMFTEFAMDDITTNAASSEGSTGTPADERVEAIFTGILDAEQFTYGTAAQPSTPVIEPPVVVAPPEEITE
jgi:hypothetical protein